MSGINNMMNLGKGALMAHQRRMATHQNNVANAATPGYRRERVNLEALGQYTGLGGQGVRAGHVQSIKAPLVDRVVPEKRGEVAMHGQITEAARLAEALGQEDGLSDRLSSFFSSARALEVDAQSEVARRDFLGRAESLATAIQNRHDELHTQRQLGAQRAEDTVGRLNDTLQELETIETQMLTSPGVPELVDARDQLVNDIADMTGARVVPDSRGRVSLVTSKGTALFEGGRAREVSFTSDPQGFEITLGDGRSLSELSGELGGLRQADREVFGASLGRLDEFAQGFASSVNQLHAQGTGLDGSTGLDLFTFDPQGAAGTLAVNSAIVEDPSQLALTSDAATLPGGNDLAKALAELEGQGIVNGQTAQDLLLADASAIGKVFESAQRDGDVALGALEQVEAIQASISGVSLEEEMVALTQAQRSYEASVKLIQTADELMQTVLSLK